MSIEIPVRVEGRFLGFDVINEGEYMPGDFHYNAWFSSFEEVAPEEVGKPFDGLDHVLRKPKRKPSADMTPGEVDAELNRYMDAAGIEPKTCYVIGIPEGYAKVEAGRVEAGDQLFYRDTKSFKPADSKSIGLPVASRLWVMRKAGPRGQSDYPMLDAHSFTREVKS